MKLLFESLVTVAGFVFISAIIRMAFSVSGTIQKSRRQVLLRLGVWFLSIASLLSFVATVFAGPWPVGKSVGGFAFGLTVLICAITMLQFLVRNRDIRKPLL